MADTVRTLTVGRQVKKQSVWGVSMTPVTFGTGGNGEFRASKFKAELEALLKKQKVESVVTLDEWQ